MIVGMVEHPEQTGDERTERTRLIIDAPAALNAAAQLRASKESVRQRRRVTKSEVIVAILSAAFATELKEIEGYEPPEPPKPRRKPST